MGNNINEKLIIFDGTSILNDFYHRSLTKEFQEWKKGNLSEEEAFNSLLKSTNGSYINGVQGFLKLFFELVDVQNPSHLIVVWGSFREKNFRNTIYPDYKGSSTELDYPLKEQFSTLKNILSKIGVIQYSSHKYESQDLAGSIAKHFGNEIPTYIFTRNSNALQLVEYANVWMKTKDSFELSRKFSLDLSHYPKDYVLYNKDLVNKIIGLNYNQIADYKAVIGNKNSGIPGAKGVGKESIIPLLKHFNSIEEFYSKLETLEEHELNDFGVTLKEKLSLKKNPIKPLLEHKNEVLISKELTTIKTDIISSLPKGSNPLNLTSLVTNINISNVIDELKKIDLTPIVKKEGISFNKNTILSSLIQTYNPYILSPSSKVFIGDSIKNIDNNIVSNISSIIYLPKIANIVKLRNDNVSNEDFIKNNLNTNTESKLPTLSKDKMYITTDDILLDEGDTFNPDVDSILNTLPKNSLLKTLLNEDKIDININDNCNVSVDSTEYQNNNPFLLMDSFTVKRYKCSHCNNEFTVINSQPKFCPNCGFGKNNDNEYKTEENLRIIL